MCLSPSWVLRFLGVYVFHSVFDLRTAVLLLSRSDFSIERYKSLRSYRFTETALVYVLPSFPGACRTKHSFVRYSVDELSFHTHSSSSWSLAVAYRCTDLRMSWCWAFRLKLKCICFDIEMLFISIFLICKSNLKNPSNNIGNTQSIIATTYCSNTLTHLGNYLATPWKPPRTLLQHIKHSELLGNCIAVSQ